MWTKRRKLSFGKSDRKRLPVLLAAGLFLCALLSFCYVKYQPGKQAERWMQTLFTAEQRSDLADVTETGLPALYEVRLEGRVTENGIRELNQYGVPYIFLFRSGKAPVVRAVLKEADTRREKTDLPDRAVFSYEASVELVLEKGQQVLAPVEEEVYHGTLTLLKKGISGWKLDGFTLEGGKRME